MRRKKPLFQLHCSLLLLYTPLEELNHSSLKTHAHVRIHTILKKKIEMVISGLNIDWKAAFFSNNLGAPRCEDLVPVSKQYKTQPSLANNC